MTSAPEATSNTAAVRFMSIELVELLGIAGTAEAGALEALAAVLAGAHAFGGLSDRDASRVAETVAIEVIRCRWALGAAAAALDDRGNEVLTDRHSDSEGFAARSTRRK